MIVYKATRYLETVGGEMTQHCSRCGQSRMFKTYLQYRCFAMYWVFGVITERKYLQLCEVCNTGIEIPKEQLALHNLKQIPIPFMRRFGLALFVSSIVALAAWPATIGKM